MVHPSKNSNIDSLPRSLNGCTRSLPPIVGTPKPVIYSFTGSWAPVRMTGRQEPTTSASPTGGPHDDHRAMPRQHPSPSISPETNGFQTTPLMVSRGCKSLILRAKRCMWLIWLGVTIETKGKEVTSTTWATCDVLARAGGGSIGRWSPCMPWVADVQFKGPLTLAESLHSADNQRR